MANFKLQICYKRLIVERKGVNFEPLGYVVHEYGARLTLEAVQVNLGSNTTFKTLLRLHL